MHGTLLCSVWTGASDFSVQLFGYASLSFGYVPSCTAAGQMLIHSQPLSWQVSHLADIPGRAGSYVRKMNTDNKHIYIVRIFPASPRNWDLEAKAWCLIGFI